MRLQAYRGRKEGGCCQEKGRRGRSEEKKEKAAQLHDREKQKQICSVCKKPKSDTAAHPNGQFCPRTAPPEGGGEKPKGICSVCKKPKSDTTAHPNGRFCPRPSTDERSGGPGPKAKAKAKAKLAAGRGSERALVVSDMGMSLGADESLHAATEFIMPDGLSLAGFLTPGNQQVSLVAQMAAGTSSLEGAYSKAVDQGMLYAENPW